MTLPTLVLSREMAVNKAHFDLTKHREDNLRALFDKHMATMRNRRQGQYARDSR